MNYSDAASPDALAARAVQLRAWLLGAAFPLWWQVGADRAAGGYCEQIAHDGGVVALPRRSRVAARMVFCYHEAGRLGWDGPWREAGRHALAFLRERFVQDDGTVIASAAHDGSPVGTSFDLYDQAFALLAYACAHRLMEPDGGWRERARILMETLGRDFAHPDAGYREDRDGRLPLRANPHMHLLEAALVWMTVDDNPRWRDLADSIVALCLDRFIDSRSGALHEFFAADWTALAGPQGELVEPGHLYEWAFLLDRWAASTGRERPAAVARLIGFADRYGIDRRRGVAVNAIDVGGNIRDPIARLWPQTERLRAYLIDRGSGFDARVHEAADALARYLDAPLSGLWYENLAPDGHFMIQAAPATSLYHIVGAAVELWATFGARAPAGAPVLE